jgi:hypothetical protein
MHRMLDAGPPACIAAQRTDGIIIERLIRMLLRREKPVGRLAAAVVYAQPLQQRRG